jgi:hypothetical protein
MGRRLATLVVGIVSAVSLVSSAGIARADEVRVSGEDGTLTVRVYLENWCFGSPEYPAAFYCTTVDETRSVSLP